MPMENLHYFWMGGFWIFPVLMFVLMLVCMFVCMFVCARAFFAGSGSRSFCGPRQWDRYDESALEVAKRRYAAGEISREEFDEIKKTIV